MDDSRNSDDFVDDELEEDDEATLDEEEALLDDDEDEDDARLLEEESEMDIEELRRRYGYGAPAPDCVEDEAEEEAEMPGTSAAATQPLASEALDAARDSYFMAGDDDEEEDVDYVEPIREVREEDKKKVRIGPEFQIEVPPFSEDEAATNGLPAQGDNGQLLWDSSENVPSTPALNDFLAAWLAAREASTGEGGEEPVAKRRKFEGNDTIKGDDEDALMVLQQHRGIVDEALKAFSLSQHANECRLTRDPRPAPWTTDEEDAFDAAMRVHDKNGLLVNRVHADTKEITLLPSRTNGELVEHYYRWKLSPRGKAYKAWKESEINRTEQLRKHEQRSASLAAYEAFTAELAAEKVTAESSTDIHHHHLHHGHPHPHPQHHVNTSILWPEAAAHAAEHAAVGTATSSAAERG